MLILCKKEVNMYTYVFRKKKRKDKNQNLIKLVIYGLGKDLKEWDRKGNLDFSE